MAADATDIATVLADWRRSGADRVDTLAFQRIAALQRRAAGRDGAVRQALEAHLAGLVAGYAAQLDAARNRLGGADADAAHAHTGDRSRRRGRARSDDPTARDSSEARGVSTTPDGSTAPASLTKADDSTASDLPATPAGVHARSLLGELADALVARNRGSDDLTAAAYPELPALDEFRQLWSQLRTGSQVRQSLARVPTGAGPLNSGALAHRALTLMRTLSPDYLRAFMAYADTLSWLETLQDAGVLTGKEATPTASGKPRAKAKPRKRKA